MANGFDVTAQQHAYRAIRAAVPSAVAVETKPRTNGAIPYVYVGETEIRDHPVGREIILRVETWSKKEGPIECKQLQHAVFGALDDTRHLDVSESPSGSGAWRYTLIHEEYRSTRLEASNGLWHGTQRFRVLAETI